MPEAKHVKLADFLQRKKANKDLVIIDVRAAEKFSEGHIPGAVNIHKSVITGEISSKVPDKSREIVCHCGGGESGIRSAEALAAMGYKNVSVLDGGIRFYKASGGEMVK